MHIDIRVLELLSSKLCHDLISPVSAINNGVELIQEIGESVVDEAMRLIGDSAGLASRRLKVFRLAYGRAGSEPSLALPDVKPVMESYFEGGKITLGWHDGVIPEELLGKTGTFKVIINMLLLGEEILPYGGTVAVSRLDNNELKGIRIEVSGRSAQLSEAMRDALEGKTPPEELTPRSVQSYVAGQFAANFGFSVEHSQFLPDRLDFKLFCGAF